MTLQQIIVLIFLLAFGSWKGYQALKKRGLIKTIDLSKDRKSIAIIVGIAVILIALLWGWSSINSTTFKAWGASGMWAVTLLFGVGSIALLISTDKTAKKYWWMPLAAAVVISYVGIRIQMAKDDKTEHGDSHSRVTIFHLLNIPKDYTGKGYSELILNNAITVKDAFDYNDILVNVAATIDTNLSKALVKSPPIGSAVTLEGYQSFSALRWEWKGKYLGYQAFPTQQDVDLGEAPMSTFHGRTRHLVQPMYQSTQRMMLVNNDFTVADGAIELLFVSNYDSIESYTRKFLQVPHHVNAFKQSLNRYIKSLANPKRRVQGMDAPTLLMPAYQDSSREGKPADNHIGTVDFSTKHLKIKITGNCIKPGSKPARILILYELPFTGQLTDEQVAEYYFRWLPHKAKNELDPELFRTYK